MDTSSSWQQRSGNVLDALSHQPRAGAPEPSADGPPNPAAADSPPSHSEVLPLSQRFTRFEVIGVGGFATVFRARDNVLGRIVALKLPHLPLSVLPEAARRRFVTELRASAALHHPNIVPVFDAGLDHDQCFLVSEYIAGTTLAKWQAEQAAAVCPLVAAEIVGQLADAVQHAHDANILHRDLKPSNILVAANRASGGLTFTPRITDFGLARMCEADVTATQDGHVLGSPPYMSPEQAQGRNSQLGPPADVYSLGVILYQLLTRQLPTSGPTSAAVLHAVIHDEPWPPRHHRPELPNDLNAICVKCLEKEPARRYATARELAADLRRFLDGQPVSVRLPNVLERTWRWSKRFPAWASLVVTVIVSLLTVMTLLTRNTRTVATLNNELFDTNGKLTSANKQLKTALRESQLAAQRAEAEELRAREAVYVSDIRRGFEAWQKCDALELQAVVARYAGDEPDGTAASGTSRASLRGPEWHWLRRQFHRESREITRLPHAVYRMALAPDGLKLVVAGRDDLIRVVELASGRTLDEWPAGQREVNGLAFSPDGQTLWTGGDDGTLKAWNFVTRTEQFRIDAHPGKYVYEIVHDPQRNWLITCGNEPTIRLWDASSGESRGTLTGHTNSIDVIVLHPDGRRLFSGATDQTIRVWDLESQTGTKLTNKTNEKVFGLSVSSDGRWLAAGMSYGQLLVWDLKRNEPRMNLQLKDSVDRVCIDTAHRRIFALDAIGVTTEWSIPTVGRPIDSPSEPISLWQNNGVKPYDALLSPDGQELLTAGKDGRVIAFRLSPQATDEFTLRLPRALDFAWLENHQLAVAEDHRLIVIEDFAATQEPRVLDDSNTWNTVEVSGDGSLLAAKSSDSEIGVWRLADRQRLVKKVASAPQAHKGFSFSADGRWLAIAHSTGARIEILDTQTGETVRQFESQSCFHALFSPCGNLLAFDGYPTASTAHRDLKLLDWPSGHLRASFPSRSVYAGTHVISADGRWIAMAADRTVQLNDTQTGKMVHEFFGHRGDIRYVAFSPDSRRLATVGSDSCVKLWHIPTGQFLLDFPLTGRTSASRCQFSRDGHWLAYASSPNSLRLMRMK